jgi:hypothetical protein
VPFPATTPIPLLDAVADSGLYINAILLNLEATLNKRIAACGGFFTPEQIVKDYEAVTGNKVQLNAGIGYEAWSQFLPAIMREELIGNFQLIESPGYYVGEPADTVDQGYELLAKSGLRKPHTFKEYLEGSRA